ncbi:hypothetical protein F1880_000929 [Penicillium rolfsii]|nr:hypothetical protein F1880_000929 [Penicillium rolfsii]
MHTLPPAPGPWAGPETMQRWLQAKIEEDRRCQEEEKTRQETMKLERRKVDHAILVEALRGGVPPHLAPLVLGAVDGPVDGKPATPEAIKITADLARYSSVPSHQPQAHPGVSQSATLPSLSHQFSTPTAGISIADLRTISANAYASSLQNPSPVVRDTSSQLPAGGLGGGNGGCPPFVSTVISSNELPAGHSSRPMELTTQSRPNSGFHAAHSLGAPRPSLPNPPRGQYESRPRRPSPSIAFHHWIPPGQSKPQASSNGVQGEHVLPLNGSAQLRPEIKGSPVRKRKSLSIHHQMPSPSSRSSGPTEESSRHSRQSPAGSPSGQTSVQGDFRRYSDVSTSREPSATEKGHTENRFQREERPQTYVENSGTTDHGPYELRRPSTGERVKHEDNNQESDQEDQRQYFSRGRSSAS